MREQIRDKERLEHILAAIDVLVEYRQRYNIEAVQQNPILFFGFVKHVEIIGEAVYKLTKEFRERHPQVDWNVIEGMRHILVHDYYQIRPQQVMKTIDEDIQPLRCQIVEFLAEEP